MPVKRLLCACCALLLLLSGCGGVVSSPPAASPTASPAAPSDETPSETAAPSEPDVSEAYFLVFEHLFGVDPGLNADIRYLALDLTSVLAEDREAIVRRFEDYCAENGLTLLLDTFAGLTEKGYIEDFVFEDGLFFRFEDEQLTEDTLVTEAMKWRSGDGADGATYTVALKENKWEITEAAGAWIS